jgi:ubiquinol-cytochrome c reductase cytochrome c subunit
VVTSAKSHDAPINAPGAPRQRGRGRRRMGAALRMLAALVLAGGIYSVLAPGAHATAPSPDLAPAGQALYETSCISCHGSNGQGVEGRGPSLIGVGSAAVEFQVNTGRMPAAAQGAQIQRTDPKYTTDEAAALGAYIQQLGGGPQLPSQSQLEEGIAKASIARGGDLFRLNCSSCHAFSAGGGALSSGKYAPSLEPSSDMDIYAAMVTGPQNMPVFGNNQLTAEEKYDVIAYVQNLKSDVDPGGWGLGRFGPVTEGLAIFLFGIVVLVFTSLWIAGKS